ncbi:MAG: hypothetical protein K1X53_13345 [Candidatus Sumerlaeaceae bacterium]|nr:hypothetical protein [Candidatus Sumerlaeaceae bacterium]
MSRKAPLLVVILVAMSCEICAETASDRGFNQENDFARVLRANPATASAADRSADQITTIPLQPRSFELTRNAAKALEFELTTQPLLARLSGSIWHLGTTKSPPVKVNGMPAGGLMVSWPTLAQRNYITFTFDDPKTSGAAEHAVDYQGWLATSCMIDGALLHPGKNKIEVSVGTDQVMLRDMDLEILSAPDKLDTVHDFRTAVWHQDHP